MKWHKGTFRIDVYPGTPDTVSGWVSADGLWGIDKPLPGSGRGGPWALAHLPSGQRAAYARTLAVAKQTAANLSSLPGVDWSSKAPFKGPSSRAREATANEVRRIVLEADGA